MEFVTQFQLNYDEDGIFFLCSLSIIINLNKGTV